MIRAVLFCCLPMLVLVVVSTTLRLESPTFVFYAHCDNEEEIYLFSVRAGWAYNLTRNSVRDYAPSWSPDGTKIAFSSLQSPPGLYIMNDDGSDQRLVSLNYQGSYINPVWSPDGSRIAVEFYTPITGENTVRIIDVNGEDIYAYQTQIGNAKNPAWSPDGTGLAYVSGFDGNGDIVIRNFETGETLNLTGDQGFDEIWPAWSPDGTKIAYVSRFVNGRSHMLLMDVESGEFRRLTTKAGFYAQLSWSGDGTRIAFQASTLGDYIPNIFVMNADGSGLHRVTNTKCFENFPDWRP